MTQLFTNRASAKLAAPVAPSDTTIALQSGQGAEMPALSGADFFIGTLQTIDGSVIEIVKVTARSTDTLTVTRGEEGTSAGTFAIGDTFDLRLTAGGLALFPQATLDTDGTLAADSDTSVASQKATKTYADTKIPKSIITTKGDLVTATGSGAPVRLGVGADGNVLTADSAQTDGVKWAAPSSTSPTLTTKGDLLTRSASAEVRLPVGTDTFVLTADSSQTDGVKWAAPSTGGAKPFGAAFTGGGLPMTLTGDTKIRYGPLAAGGTVSKVALVADQSGSVTIGVKKCARTSYPGSLADVTGGHDVVLSSAAQMEDSTLTGWTTAFSADDVFEFQLKAVDGVLDQISILVYP